MLKRKILFALPILYAAFLIPLEANFLPLIKPPPVQTTNFPSEATDLEFPQSKIFKLDNRTFGDINDLLGDPLLILRAQFPFEDEDQRISAAWDFAAKMYAEDDFDKDLGVEFDPLSLHPHYAKFEGDSGALPGKVINQSNVFDHVKPNFELDSTFRGDQILWKITRKEDAGNVLVARGIAKFSDKIELTELQSTYLSPEQDYLFEYKVLGKSSCSGWSKPYPFEILKPFRPKDVEFEKIKANVYEISWTEFGDDHDVQYLVFASNSRDFIPSIYYDKQIKSIDDGKPSKFEKTDNFIGSISDTRITIDGSYAFYRIVAEKNGCYSNPTGLIYVYDNEIQQNRDVLTYDAPLKCATRRSLDLHGISSTKNLHAKGFVQNKFISDAEWAKAEPYLIPDNHPMKDRLDRIFLRRRASMDTNTMRRAGFDDPYPRGMNRPVVSRHRILEGHLVKLYLDTQSGINDASRLTRRPIGAESIAEAIKRLGMENIFKVPKKFLYPLPELPGTDPMLDRKKFILLVKDMNILPSEKNRKKWKGNGVTHDLLDAVFEIFEDQGLADSTFAFNIPFDKKGYIAIIDTEVHHSWPVPYEKFKKYLNASNQNYWDSITKHRRKHK